MRKLVPTPSMFVALLALAVAMSGTAYAAATINGKNIKKNTVTSKQIKNKTITSTDIKNGTITGSKVKGGTLTADKLAAGVIPTPVPTAIGTATSSSDYTVPAGLAGFDVPDMSVSYTVPAGANKIVAQFTAECEVSTTIDDQHISARIIVDGVTSGVSWNNLCGAADEEAPTNSGSGGETFYSSGVATRVIALGPGTHTIKVQALQNILVTGVLGNKTLTVTSGS